MSRGARARVADLSAPPNLATLSRLALLPVALAFLSHGRRAEAAAVLLVMVATDGLDGYLARRLGRVTELGKILDPVADKVAIDAVLVYLGVVGEFPLWALAILLVRDAGILAGAALMARRLGSVPAASAAGKAALVVLAAMTVAFAADLEILEPVFLVAGIGLAVFSGFVYLGEMRVALRGRARVVPASLGRRTDGSGLGRIS